MPPRFGVDHNFPEPLLEAIRGYLPFGVEMIKRISPLLVDNVDDWQVLLALAQQRYHGFISLDFEAIALPKEMAVVHQTKLTVVAIEAAGDNPLRAVGQLLIHATHIEKNYRAEEPQVFKISPPRLKPPVTAWNCLGEIAGRQTKAVEQLFREHRLTNDDLQRDLLAELAARENQST
jgi:hypothetical protein